MEIHQSENYTGDNYWKWSVWIEAPSDELDRVQFVEWRLHPTFSNPVRKKTDRASNFRLDTSGWGVFMIHALVQHKDGTAQRLQHYLQLHYPEGDANQK